MGAQKPLTFNQLLRLMQATSAASRKSQLEGADEPKPQRLPDDLELVEVRSKRGRVRLVPRRTRERG